jgi:hypothetical protein
MTTEAEREIEIAKRERSRRWVREYESAMGNIRAAWFSDLESRKISWVGRDKGKPRRKQASRVKQKVGKPSVVRVG